VKVGERERVERERESFSDKREREIFKIEFFPFLTTNKCRL